MSVPLSGGYYRSGPQINFDWISQAWRLFQAQAGTWIGAMLLFLLVGAVIDVPVAFITGYAQQLTSIFGAMQTHQAPPQPNPFVNFGQDLLFGLAVTLVQTVLTGGLYRMAIRQGRGEVIQATDVFSALDVALPLIGVGLITQVLVTLGSYLCIIPGLIVAGLFMFAPLLVVDRRLGPIQAITQSVNLLKGQLLMATLFYFVAALLGGLGAILCVIGLVVTYPILVNSVAQGYLAFQQTDQPVPYPQQGAPPPGVWPPPPSV